MLVWILYGYSSMGTSQWFLDMPLKMYGRKSQAKINVGAATQEYPLARWSHALIRVILA
jgi:hypothetical protein